MAAGHVLGSAKNVAHCVCMYVLAPSLIQSGFPLSTHTKVHTKVSGLPELQCLRHAAASDGDPVTDSQMTLFPSPFINTAPRAFFDNKTTCLRAVERSGGRVREENVDA